MGGGLGPRQAHFAEMAESFLYRRTASAAWHLAQEGLPEPKGTMVQFLTTQEREPRVFYAASGRGVYRSSDQGEHWERLALDLPQPFHWQHTQGLVVAAA